MGREEKLRKIMRSNSLFYISLFLYFFCIIIIIKSGFLSFLLLFLCHSFGMFIFLFFQITYIFVVHIERDCKNGIGISFIFYEN